MSRVTFCVSIPTCQDGVTVFVTGNCATLGNWSVHAAKPLTRVSSDNGTDQWSVTVDLSAIHLEFRYFTACYLQSFRSSLPSAGNNECIVAVQEWESGKIPRRIQLTSNTMHCRTDVYGICDGVKSVSRGWLTGQSEICMRLHGQAISLLKDFSSSQNGYRVCCEPIDMQPTINSPHACNKYNRFAPIYSAKFTDDSLLPQDGRNIVFNGIDDHVIFKVQTCAAETVAFKFSLYWNVEDHGVCSKENEIGVSIYQIGTALKTELVDVPIISSHMQIIGTLKVDAVIVNSMKNCPKAVDFSPMHWEKPQRSLNIGHRGLGSTYANGALYSRVSENTVLSFGEAAKSGADMVEFDVMLTSDNIPVIFHDFMACVTLAATDGQKPYAVKLPVSDLSLDDLSKYGAMKYQDFVAGNVVKSAEESPFPTLQHCLKVIDPRLGFNIEVKYCMRLRRTGKYEEDVQHFAERNFYVDAILQVVLQHAGDRNIVLSCFDPDVCSMMRAKQTRYPVVFLSQGETLKYETFQDPRAAALQTAVNFANIESLAGVALHADDMLKDVRLIDLAHSYGLSVIAWGEEANNADTIRLLRKYKIDGIIYDRVDELMRAAEAE